jgi:transcriptional regulator with XRE-family HTH domain
MEHDSARPRPREDVGDHELARLIHTAWRARGWTQDELGRRVGVDRDVVSTWERGHRPGRHALARLVALLGLDLAEPPADRDEPVQSLDRPSTPEPVQADAGAARRRSGATDRPLADGDGESGPAASAFSRSSSARNIHAG